MRLRYLVVAGLIALAQIIAAPTASAECTTDGNFSVCSLGGLEDSTSTGPYLPCGSDYYCNDHWDWFIP